MRRFVRLPIREWKEWRIAVWAESKVCDEYGERSVEAVGLRAVLEAIPCMAFALEGEVVVAQNALAVAANGCGEDEPVAVGRMFLGAFPEGFDGEDARRFECVMVRRGQGPVAVQGAVRPWGAMGVRLAIAQERGAASEDGQGTFLGDLLDSAPEAMAITHEGLCLHVNREFARLFGYAAESCVGKGLDGLLLPDGRGYEAEILEHMMTHEGRAWMETVRRTASGTTVDVSLLVAPVRLGGNAMGHFHTFRDIRRQKEEEARLQHDAMHDGLTGLANRALFLDRLRAMMGRLQRRPERMFAVMFLDLDGFKRVNDTEGHAAGDFLLREVARRLGECVRPQDTVARLGGDEFAVLLDEVESEADAAEVAERMQTAVCGMIAFAERTLRVSASIGIAVVTPAFASAENVLHAADVAMYAAKAAGKRQYAFAAAGRAEKRAVRR